ncbi:MAG: adenylate kinase [Actinomycetaceae bacterium]|nr:adenylate kinase [Actinomycetaceae bacterium]MDY6082849.1 adenylate kinase [Actinomycetaceae bacterium]
MAVRLIILGAPGAGKGTQGSLLAQRLNIPAISTGDIFRAHAKAQDELGKLAASYSDRGELVPDEVTNSMVEDRLAQPDCLNGFLLDGYPRNAGQVEALDAMLAAHSHKLDCALTLDVDKETVIARLLERAKIEGRLDDTEDVIRHRMDVYEQSTAPLIDIYTQRGIIVHINGVGDIKDINDALFDAVTRAVK